MLEMVGGWQKELKLYQPKNRRMLLARFLYIGTTQAKSWGGGGGGGGRGACPSHSVRRLAAC